LIIYNKDTHKAIGYKDSYSCFVGRLFKDQASAMLSGQHRLVLRLKACFSTSGESQGFMPGVLIVLAYWRIMWGVCESFFFI
jgi:hypothetical protein